jgi:hypothetical protein
MVVFPSLSLSLSLSVSLSLSLSLAQTICSCIVARRRNQVNGNQTDNAEQRERGSTGSFSRQFPLLHLTNYSGPVFHHHHHRLQQQQNAQATDPTGHSL